MSAGESSPKPVVLKLNNEDGLDESIMSSVNNSSTNLVKTERCGILPTQVSPYPVYVVICLYLMSVAVTVVASQDIIYNKLCYIKFQNLTLCSNTTFSSSHPQIQGEATKWNNYMTVVQIIPSFLSNLLLSSYCDKVGHKLPLVLPAVGTLLASAWLSVLVTPSLIQLPMELVLLYGFLMSFLGYFPMLLMSSFSYVSRARPGANRHIYITVAEATLLGGAMIGGLVSGPVIDNLGLHVLVYANTFICTVTVLIASFYVVDILKQDGNPIDWQEFFKPSKIFGVFRVVYKSRPNRKRLLLSIGFLAYICAFVGVEGFTALTYLYCVKMLGMTVTVYSIYSSVINLLRSTLGPLTLILAKKLQWNKLSVAQAASVSLTAAFVIISLRPDVYFLWIGSAFLFPQVVVYGVIRHNLIGLVEEDEYGKVFSFIALLQILIQLAATIFFNSVYGWTIYFWPQMFSAICGLAYFFSFTLLSVFIVLKIHYLHVD